MLSRLLAYERSKFLHKLDNKARRDYVDGMKDDKHKFLGKLINGEFT